MFHVSFILHAFSFLPDGRRGLGKSIPRLSRKHFSSFHFRLRNSSTLTSFGSSCRQNFPPPPLSILSDLTEVARSVTNSTSSQFKAIKKLQTQPPGCIYGWHSMFVNLDFRDLDLPLLTMLISLYRQIVTDSDQSG